MVVTTGSRRFSTKQDQGVGETHSDSTCQGTGEAKRGGRRRRQVPKLCCLT